MASAFVMWFLTNVLIPMNLCIATNGIYIPDQPLARQVCYSVIGQPGTTFLP